MKKNKINSSLQFSNQISVSQNGTKSILLHILTFSVLIFFPIYGSLFTLIYGYEIDISNFFILVTCSVFSLGFSALYHSPVKKWVLPIALLVGALFIFINFEEIWFELAEIVNTATSTKLDQNISIYLRLIQPMSPLYQGTLLCGSLIFIQAAVCGFFIAYKPNVLVVFLMTFPLIELVILTGLSLNIFAVSITCVSYLTILIISLSTQSTNSYNKKNKQKNKLYAYSGKKYFLSTIQVTFCFILVALLACYGAVETSRYKRSENVDNLRNELMNYDFSSIFYNPDFARGNLNLAGNKRIYEKTDLKVTVPVETNYESESFDGTVYLKGYSANIYTNGVWSQTNETIFKSSDFYKLLEEDNATYNVVAPYLSSDVIMKYTIANSYLSSTYGLQTITVKPVRVGYRYAFLPNAAFPGPTYSAITDQYSSPTQKSGSYDIQYFWLPNNSESSYHFLSELDNPREPDEFILDENYNSININNLPKEYQNLYEDYIKENYLDIPNRFERLKTDSIKIKEICLDNNANPSYGDLNDLVSAYLSSQATYTLTPGSLPAGKDPINYFLYENQKGYCAHFASAATIMYRSMGIPARYVEGYVVTQGDSKKGTISEKLYDNQTIYSPTSEKETFSNSLTVCEMEITDANAHSWVEIYVSGYGWIPLESTPGYSGGNDVLPTIDPTVAQKPADLVSPIKAEQNPYSDDRNKNDDTSSNEEDNAVNGTNSIFNLLSPLEQLIVSAVLLLILFSIVILIRRFIILFIRKRKYKKSNFNQIVIFKYAILVKMLKSEKVDNPQDICYHLDKAYIALSSFDKSHVSKYMAIVLKARFSKESISKNELELITAFNDKFYSILKYDRSLFKRIYLKYFLVVK